MVKIKWTQPARDDLKAISEYISRYSKIYANRLIKSLINTTIKLEKMPYCGRIVPEVDSYSLREIIHNNYRIVYLVKSNNDIDIIRVIHTSRDFKQQEFVC